MIGLTVFVTGAAVMILELLGSRMLAPYVGSSLLVWTNVIGIILASMSLGYWLGGRIADRSTKQVVIGRIVTLAAGSIALIRVLYEPILLALQQTHLALHWQALLGGIILFCIPSALLAMISPYAVRLSVRRVANSGSTVGRLSALATVGSIVGTFAAGLWLIPTIGTHALLTTLSILLLLLATPYVYRHTRDIVAWIVVLVGTLAATQSTSPVHVRSIDTAYSQIWIYDTISQDGQPVRMLRQNHDASSAMYINNPTDLVFPYTQAYDIAFSYVPTITHALVIGGAAYSYPKHLLKQPNITVDVVEIDPRVTQLASDYFALPASPRLRIFSQDARPFLNTTKDTYDVIYFDVFNSETIPFHVTTQEVVQSVASHLRDNGMVVMNIIASASGKNSRFLWSEYATYKTVFPYVTVLQVDPSIPRDHTQNIILTAQKNPPVLQQPPINTTVANALAQPVTPPSDSGMVLTDDFAPVEYLVAHAVTDVVQ